MYAAVVCRNCQRYRIIDKSVKSSKCPYCSVDVEHRSLMTLFEHDNQSVVRDAITEMTFSPEPEKKKGPDPDPHSTLVYRYERSKDTMEKMEILSKGLTEIYGTFTLKDVETVEPEHAERMIKGMLELCLIHETEHGVYKG